MLIHASNLGFHAAPRQAASIGQPSVNRFAAPMHGDRFVATTQAPDVRFGSLRRIAAAVLATTALIGPAAACTAGPSVKPPADEWTAAPDYINDIPLWEPQPIYWIARQDFSLESKVITDNVDTDEDGQVDKVVTQTVEQPGPKTLVFANGPNDPVYQERPDRGAVKQWVMVRGTLHLRTPIDGTYNIDGTFMVPVYQETAVDNKLIRVEAGQTGILLQVDGDNPVSIISFGQPWRGDRDLIDLEFRNPAVRDNEGRWHQHIGNMEPPNPANISYFYDVLDANDPRIQTFAVEGRA